MCAKALTLLLVALFTFVVATVAAFTYLEWWQAVLASAATFWALVLAGKLYVRYAFRNLRRLAQGLFPQRVSPLRGATLEVHSVKPAAMPGEARERTRQVIDGAHPDARPIDPGEDYADAQWVEVEATIFPDPRSGDVAQAWSLDDLRAVPFEAAKPEPLSAARDGAPEFALWDAQVIRDGAPLAVGEPAITGPCRIRFTLGVPRGIRLLKLRHVYEQFGRVELPPSLGLPPKRTA